MRIILKHVLRNLKDNKKRTFLIGFSLLIIGMFVSFISSFGFFLFNMKDVIIEGFSLGYDYTIVDKDNEIIEEHQIESLDYEFDKTGIIYNQGYIKVKDKENIAHVIATDFQKAAKFNILKQKNGDTITLNDFEIIILEDMLKDLNLSIGDKIKYISKFNEEFELTIKDTITDSHELSYEKSKYYTFATNISTYEKITNQKAAYSSYFVIFDKKLNDEEYKNFENDCELNGLKIVNKEDEMNVSMTGIKTILIPAISFFILILCIVVYFVNKSFLKILLNERIPIMGTFRSLGATRKKVNFILMLEMALYGIIAGMIGTFLGIIVVKLIVNVILAKMLANEISGFDFTILGKAIDNNIVLISIMSISFVTVFQLFLSHKEISNSSKKSIKDCIFSKYDDIYIHNNKSLINSLTGVIIVIIMIIFKEKANILLAIIAIVALIYSIVKMLPIISKLIIEKNNFKSSINIIATRNFVNSKLLINSTIVMSILLLVIISLISMADQVYEDNNKIKDKYKFDLILENSGYVTEENLVDIKNMDEIVDLVTVKQKTLTQEIFIANNKMNDFTLLTTDNPSKLYEMNNTYKGIEAISSNGLEENEIILNKDLAKEFNLKENDEFYISIKKSYDNYEVELPVYVKIKFLHENNKSMAIISEKLYKDMTEILSEGYNTIYFDAKEGADLSKLSKRINDMLGEQFVESKLLTFEEYKEQLNSETTTEYIINIIICLVLGLVVLLCIVNNFKISFEQRKKEFATMYSICMSRTQLKKMIRVEVLTSTLVSILLSTIYAFFFTKLCEIILDTQLLMTPKSILIISIIVITIMHIVSIRIGKQIDKLNIIDEIKYE